MCLFPFLLCHFPIFLFYFTLKLQELLWMGVKKMSNLLYFTISFSFSQICEMLNVGLSHASCFVELCLFFFFNFPGPFSWKCFVLCYSLLCVCWDGQVISVLKYINVMDDSCFFTHAERFWSPWNDANLVMETEFSSVLSNSVSKRSTENFWIPVHPGDWPMVLLVILLLCRFWFWCSVT